jgi:putative membrane protein
LKTANLVRTDAEDRRHASTLITGFPFALARQLRSGRSLGAGPHFERDASGLAGAPADLAGRMESLAAEWNRSGKMDLAGMWAVEANVRAMMDVGSHCERVASTPVPASFHALLRHGLILSLFLAPWHLIHTLGVWALPVQALIIYFLFGVELTAEEIENPFGEDTDDLPLTAYCTAIQRDVEQILSTGRAPTIEAAKFADAASAIPGIVDDRS